LPAASRATKSCIERKPIRCSACTGIGSGSSSMLMPTGRPLASDSATQLPL
jgi:hypothetical protein